MKWVNQALEYRSVVDKVFVWEEIQDPDVSVVVVAHQFKEKIPMCVKALKHQQHCIHQIIYVSNGFEDPREQQIREHVDVEIRVNRNTGAYMSRNIGSLFADGKILVFVDDDGIPSSDAYLYSFKKCFDSMDIVSVRGKCLVPNGIIPAFYDMGDFIFPSYPQLEGNCAILKDAFYEVGGWDDEILFGGGGLEISFRLLQAYPEYGKQIYCPDPVLIHVYAEDSEDLRAKQCRQEQGRSVWQNKHPEWEEVRATWNRLYREQLYANIPRHDHVKIGVVSKSDIQQALHGVIYSMQNGELFFKGDPIDIKKKLNNAGFNICLTQNKHPFVAELYREDKKIIIRQIV
jgi:glycosyltransferase involved in cell wall biosynthesis